MSAPRCGNRLSRAARCSRACAPRLVRSRTHISVGREGGREGGRVSGWVGGRVEGREGREGGEGGRGDLGQRDAMTRRELADRQIHGHLPFTLSQRKHS